MRNQRKKIWIDRFQTYLALRIALYCALYQIAAWAVVVTERRMNTALEGALGPAAARARDHIFGFTIFNDFSARDAQRKGRRGRIVVNAEAIKLMRMSAT